MFAHSRSSNASTPVAHICGVQHSEDAKFCGFTRCGVHSPWMLPIAMAPRRLQPQTPCWRQRHALCKALSATRAIALGAPAARGPGAEAESLRTEHEEHPCERGCACRRGCAGCMRARTCRHMPTSRATFRPSFLLVLLSRPVASSRVYCFPGSTAPARQADTQHKEDCAHDAESRAPRLALCKSRCNKTIRSASSGISTLDAAHEDRKDNRLEQPDAHSCEGSRGHGAHGLSANRSYSCRLLPQHATAGPGERAVPGIAARRGSRRRRGQCDA